MPSVPYTFHPNTTIESAKVNANFQALEGGLTEAGGELSGGFTVDTDNAYDLGSATKGFRYIYVHALRLFDVDGSNYLSVVEGSNLTANRTLTILTGDASRTLTLNGDVTLDGTPYTVGGTDIALGDGGTGTTLADPGADRIMFWDDSDGTVDWLIVGSGLIISGKTISATGSLSVSGTDNHLVRMDGTTGVQDSAGIIDDSGNCTGIADLKVGTTSNMSWAGKTVGTIYQAASDGFVVFFANEATGLSTIVIHTDASNPPTTVRGVFTYESSSCSDGGAMSPVKKGDYYRVAYTINSGGNTPTAYWVPMGISG